MNAVSLTPRLFISPAPVSVPAPRVPPPARAIILPTATLRTRDGTLTIRVLRYESPATASDADRNRLVARVTWESATATVTHLGPIFEAGELRDFAARLQDAGDLGEDEFLFHEPHFAFSHHPARGEAPEAVAITISGAKAIPWEDFDVMSAVQRASVVAFGRSLERLSRAFPERPSLQSAPASSRSDARLLQ